MFVAVLIVYGCVNIPLHIGFDLEAGLAQVIADATVDVMFFLDMIFSFRTAFFVPDGVLVTNSGNIAFRYLKGKLHDRPYVNGSLGPGDAGEGRWGGHSSLDSALAGPVAVTPGTTLEAVK